MLRSSGYGPRRAAGGCKMPCAQLPGWKGVYIVVFALREGYRGRVGSRAAVSLEPGVYAYLGSAWGPGGVRARLCRHLYGRRARLHWHMDYLAAAPGYRPLGAVAVRAPRGSEPLLAAAAYASRCFEPLEPGLGGTDDPYGLSHVLRCAARDCLSAALGLASSLPGLLAVHMAAPGLAGPRHYKHINSI
ncbi:hypothetical protein CF15_07805 [Pyrodictium occultum]|uniref:GIY-YIG domain-containing protein n=2 Tax=Pyrodictium occultum TaxID=2309 RepID=A0A0V8RX32_PYROC|nr:hypothetical protein CF15_07805 [Pyrodictium occultum]